MKGLYIMQALWDSKGDLSVYDIQSLLYEDYRIVCRSVTIESQLFRLSKRKFVRLYVQNHILFAHRLIERDEYRECARKRLEEREEQYRKSFFCRLEGRYRKGNEDERKMEKVLKYLEKNKD